MMQEKIGSVILDDTCYPGEDRYSDGSIEQELLAIAKSCKNEADYNAVIAEKKSWPVMYHFSHIRHNLLSWVPIRKEDKVLEIGAGCGAVTGTLAAKAGSVTCIELSRQRSLVNAWRHRDYDNITILLGAFEDVEKRLTEKYDYITLIGVFEYAALYTKAENPFVHMLTTIARHLAPGGKILIAIENRLGLKYWAGCTEDHVGRLFEGLEGYSRTPASGVRTFSKLELEKLFGEAGDFKTTFYYPYPDYKFPFSIYSDRYLPRKGDLKNNLNNYDRRRLLLFDEGKVFDSLIENGLFPQFSNSFLVFLEQEEQP
ncbi:MAG: class I SAM-dependent methyltransferase [Lachnospiraceae bacterium]|nr:class I SAM-dependent methyltransferase [Lachnospiraceae bacterium]